MEQEQLLHELEQLVEAIEDSLAVIAGTISETSDPAMTLANLVAGSKSVQALHGDNAWRERLLRSALKLTALKARSKIDAQVAAGHSDDLPLRVLIANVLGGREEDDPMH